MAASRLVFIHGRSQENKDLIKLKAFWVELLAGALASRSLKIPIQETEIKFPYYGQALFDLVSDKPKDQRRPRFAGRICSDAGARFLSRCA